MCKYNTDEHTIKKSICEIGRRLYSRGIVCGTGGNISVRCGKEEFWSTPSGVGKGFMNEDMLVKVNLQGEVTEGSFAPTSEIKMHLKVYMENSEVNAVIHAHPPVATSFAVAKIPLEKPILTETLMLLGNIPVADYGTPGTYELSDSIAEYCVKYNAVLLANHGALTWGRDINEAFYRMEMLEHYALILMYTDNIIKKTNELEPDQVNTLIQIRKNLGITGG